MHRYQSLAFSAGDIIIREGDEANLVYTLKQGHAAAYQDGVKVGEIKSAKKGVTVVYTNAKGEAVSLDVDKLIISIGRVANTTGLAADAVGLQLDERREQGMVVVVELRRIQSREDSVERGVVAHGPAHLAEAAGVPELVAEILAGLDALLVKLHVLAQRRDLQ